MAEGARLESVCSECYRGFESRPLRHEIPFMGSFFWGSSSVGRAVRSQRTGRRFDPALLHKMIGCARWGVSGAL